MLTEQIRLHQAYVTDVNKAASYRSRRLVQRRLREMQEAWAVRKAEESHGYVDHNEKKNFFAITAVCGPPTKGHLRTTYSARATPAAASSPSSVSPFAPKTNIDRTPEPPLPSSSSSHSSSSSPCSSSSASFSFSSSPLLLHLFLHCLNIRYGVSCTHHHCTQS
ncbi:hypothetical protein SprV_0100178300 [Sparganum proliferum]